MNQTVMYEGHYITISPQEHHRGLRYWFIIDGRPINFASNPDTAKRLAARFIDVVTDAHDSVSRQPVSKTSSV